MLGWEFFITRQSTLNPGRPDEAAPLLASWTSGLSGTDWLRQLIASGAASDLGGDGYPNRYSITAGSLADLLMPGAPRPGGPLVLGEDYVQPSGWIGQAKIANDLIQAIDPNEVLIVEAWDQS